MYVYITIYIHTYICTYSCIIFIYIYTHTYTRTVRFNVFFLTMLPALAAELGRFSQPSCAAQMDVGPGLKPENAPSLRRFAVVEASNKVVELRFTSCSLLSLRCKRGILLCRRIRSLQVAEAL